MQVKTLITYIPSKKPKKQPRVKKGPHGLVKVRKFMLLILLVMVYLVYTNQSSTLGYSLRNSLSDLEVTQDILDDIELEVGQKEQLLWSSLERVPNKSQTKKIIIN